MMDAVAVVVPQRIGDYTLQQLGSVFVRSVTI
jgi:hypothetical protein